MLQNFVKLYITLSLVLIVSNPATLLANENNCAPSVGDEVTVYFPDEMQKGKIVAVSADKFHIKTPRAAKYPYEYTSNPSIVSSSKLCLIGFVVAEIWEYSLLKRNKTHLWTIGITVDKMLEHN